jgi:hypothetical protein
LTLVNRTNLEYFFKRNIVFFLLQTERLAKFAEYQKVWAILITQTTNLMVDFSEEKLNENDLKQKLKSFHLDFIEKITKM